MYSCYPLQGKVNELHYLTGRVEDEINRPDMSTKIQTWINEARDEIADGTIPILVSPPRGLPLLMDICKHRSIYPLRQQRMAL